jgi:TolB-like protein/class 3 adenylate cyclase
LNGARPLERRLAAILVADVVGYSRLTQLDEEGTHHRWRRLLSDASSLVVTHGGRVVKTTGDGFIAEFASVVEAARAAIEWLDLIVLAEAEVAEPRRIRVRMGLSLGDVIIGEDGDVYGDGINLAARLEQKASPDTILVPDSTWKVLDGKLDRAASDLGEQRLKNIAKPIRAWELSGGRAAPSRRLSRRAKVTFGAALAIAVLCTLGWIGASRWGASPRLVGVTAPAAKLSIVVLPFDNAGGDATNDVYADAITADLITDLSRIADAFVISPNTSFSLRGKAADAQAIARQFGVRFALVGNVRRAGEDLAVSASLIDGDTGRVIWSQRFSRTRGDIFAFQQDMTAQIARTLNLELKQAASDKAAREAPKDLDAQDYALRAWVEIWNKPQSRATNEAGLRFARQALALDPDNSDALATVCYALTRAAQFGWSDRKPDELLREAARAGERAIELDPKDADAFYALAYAIRTSGDIDRAGSLLRTAVTLNVNHAPSHAALGLDRVLKGDPARAHDPISRALALSPLDPLRAVWLHHDGLAYLLAGDDVAGLRRMQEAIAANPQFPNAHLYAAAALAGLGRDAEAGRAFRRHEELRPGWTIGRLKDAVTIQASSEYARQFERIFGALRSLGMPE